MRARARARVSARHSPRGHASGRRLSPPSGRATAAAAQRLALARVLAACLTRSQLLRRVHDPAVRDGGARRRPSPRHRPRACAHRGAAGDRGDLCASTWPRTSADGAAAPVDSGLCRDAPGAALGRALIRARAETHARALGRAATPLARHPRLRRWDRHGRAARLVARRSRPSASCQFRRRRMLRSERGPAAGVLYVYNRHDYGCITREHRPPSPHAAIRPNSGVCLAFDHRDQLCLAAHPLRHLRPSTSLGISSSSTRSCRRSLSLLALALPALRRGRRPSATGLNLLIFLFGILAACEMARATVVGSGRRVVAVGLRRRRLVGPVHARHHPQRGGLCGHIKDINKLKRCSLLAALHWSSRIPASSRVCATWDIPVIVG